MDDSMALMAVGVSLLVILAGCPAQPGTESYTMSPFVSVEENESGYTISGKIGFSGKISEGELSVSGVTVRLLNGTRELDSIAIGNLNAVSDPGNFTADVSERPTKVLLYYDDMTSEGGGLVVQGLEWSDRCECWDLFDDYDPTADH